MLKVYFYLNSDKEIQVNIQEVNVGVAMKDLLQINRPDGYETLQESLKLERNYRALVKLIK